MSTTSSTDGSIYAAAMAHGSDPATMLQGFWVNTANDIRKMPQEEFKTSELPLARIKKIMKLDEDVKMISAEAPVLFAKAAEIFVAELTLRAWIHTEDNKRRTLQRNDIATAITKYDQFDFLIDIVPREELKPQSNKAEPSKTTMLPEQVQYYFQLAQQQQQQTSTATTQTTTQQVQSLQGAGQVLQHQQQYQTVQLATQSQQQAITLANAGGDNQQVLIQSSPQQQQQQMPQVFQQVITANGEVQNIPIQLTAAQLQAIQLQMQNKQTNQPMVLQTASGNEQQIQFVQQPTVYQIPLGQQQVYIQQESGTSSAVGSQQEQSSEDDCSRIILTEQVKT